MEVGTILVDLPWVGGACRLAGGTRNIIVDRRWRTQSPEPSSNGCHLREAIGRGLGGYVEGETAELGRADCCGGIVVEGRDRCDIVVEGRVR